MTNPKFTTLVKPKTPGQLSHFCGFFVDVFCSNYRQDLLSYRQLTKLLLPYEIQKLAEISMSNVSSMFLIFTILFCSFSHISTSTLTLTSVERFISIYFPFKAKDICSLKITKRVIVALVIIFLVFETQVFFIIDDIEGTNGTIVDCGPTGSTKSTFEVYKHLDSILYSYFPFAVMSICNVAIIIKLLMAKHKSKPDSTALSKGAKRITIMLVSVSVLFIICTLPYAVLYQVNLDVSTYSYTLIILLMYTNHSVNIIVYYVTNSQFRRELRKMFCYKVNSQVHPSMDESTM